MLLGRLIFKMDTILNNVLMGNGCEICRRNARLCNRCRTLENEYNQEYNDEYLDHLNQDHDQEHDQEHDHYDIRMTIPVTCTNPFCVINRSGTYNVNLLGTVCIVCENENYNGEIGIILPEGFVIRQDTILPETYPPEFANAINQWNTVNPFTPEEITEFWNNFVREIHYLQETVPMDYGDVLDIRYRQEMGTMTERDEEIMSLFSVVFSE